MHVLFGVPHDGTCYGPDDRPLWPEPEVVEQLERLPGRKGPTSIVDRTLADVPRVDVAALDAGVGSR